MRFVKINADAVKRTEHIRNCIAAHKAKIGKCTEEENIVNTTCTDDNKADSISADKKLRRFSFKEMWSHIRRDADKFYNRLDSRTTTTACAVISILAMVLVFNINFTFAYTAFMDGTELGNVPGKAYVEQCIADINGEFAQYVSGQDIIAGDVTYVPSVIRKGTYTDAVTLAENIKSTSDVMIRAYAVEVDGIAYTALDDEAIAENVLSQLASSYISGEDTEVSFAEDVQIINEYVPMSILVSDVDALERLRGYATSHYTVKVEEAVSVADYAGYNGMDEHEFRMLNPELGDVIDPNTTVVIAERKPVISVITTDTVSYDMQVPFTEQVTEDDGMYQGVQRVTQTGECGIATVTEQIERVNGMVVNQTVISKQVVSEPVTQLRTIGTKERPSHVGTGSFLRPYYGDISARFGARGYRGHSGVDFCGSVGDPIIAADNGTVIFSGWSGGYGNIIKIDHNNGYVTYYAHCSKLYAQVGDVVRKGDTIAAVGNTGNSTGPHVHFEVRYGDEILNPMNYVN